MLHTFTKIMHTRVHIVYARVNIHKHPLSHSTLFFKHAHPCETMHTHTHRVLHFLHARSHRTHPVFANVCSRLVSNDRRSTPHSCHLLSGENLFAHLCRFRHQSHVTGLSTIHTTTTRHTSACCLVRVNITISCSTCAC